MELARSIILCTLIKAILCETCELSKTVVKIDTLKRELLEDAAILTTAYLNSCNVETYDKTDFKACIGKCMKNPACGALETANNVRCIICENTGNGQLRNWGNNIYIAKEMFFGSYRDECLSHPCQNGGTCTDGFNKYTCTCTWDFEGIHCETEAFKCGDYPEITDDDENYFLNHGWPTEIIVRHGDVVDGIHVAYGGEMGEVHGALGGGENSLELGTGERIVYIEMYTGFYWDALYICSITFDVKRLNSSIFRWGPFGTCAVSDLNGPCSHLDLDGIQYFRSGSTGYLSVLQPKFG